MKKLLQGVVIGCTLCASPVFADEAPELEISANVGMYSKYVWRGWNLNDEASVQGGFDASFNGFSIGTWGGTDQASGTEVDIYVGYGRQITDFLSIDVGYVQYRFPETGNHIEEWHVTADFDILSTSYHKGEDGYYYLEVNSSFELTEQVTLDFHYGFEDNDQNDWHDYQLTLNYQINETYSAFVSAAEKERNDSNLFFGVKGVF
jgi:uncharacterized protein (TIGR02001 family)